jgi:hypothetical protein
MNEDRASVVHESFDKTMGTGAQTVRAFQDGVGSAVEDVRDLNVRLIAMAQANTSAAFEFAREVAAAKEPSDLVEACTAHATKQFDMLTKQASELTRLGQRLANATADSVARRGDQRE